PPAAATAGAAPPQNAVALNTTSAVSAPATNPLDTVPSDWFPQGKYDREYSARSGFIRLASGSAHVSRDGDHIGVNTDHGNFSMRRDPDHAGQVIVDSPQGTFNGTLHRDGDRVIFDDGNGRSVTMQHHSGYTRFDTSGFGAADRGHLRVFDP
ncbi:MAG: hypothetical protein ACYCW6_19985, partial [Candidatus Xenobia bacterium]